MFPMSQSETMLSLCEICDHMTLFVGIKHVTPSDPQMM